MDEVNPRTNGVYYSGSAQDIKTICAALNLDAGRLQKVTPEKIHYFMDLAELECDGILEEFYFCPIREYNTVVSDGTTKLVFPGRLRRCAQYLAAGLMLQSEFQALEPNANEAVQGYINDSRKTLYMMTVYNTRLPGQQMKLGIHNCSPTMYPSLPPSESMFS